MRLYIAGPMTGYEEHNYPAFAAAEMALSAKGHEVLSPHTNTVDEPTWDNFMRASIVQVVQAEGVAVLPGWELSAGAVLEVKIAQALRMPVLTMAQWVQRKQSQV